MAKTSVTGVGKGSHNIPSYLGVSHLIGPRWDEKKESKFKKMSYTLYGLMTLQAISLSAIVYLLIK